MLICNINILNKNGKQLLDEELKQYGFNWREMVVLLVLEQAPGSIAMFLGKFLQTDKANLTKLLHELESKNLIYKENSVTDKRSKALFLTKEGTKKLPNLKAAIQNWEQKVYKGLSPEELVEYERLNSIIMNNLIGTTDV